MERLINQLILLVNNLGGGEYAMAEMIRKVIDNDEKSWSKEDIEKLTRYISWYNEYFGKADAIARIDAMVDKYDIRRAEITFKGKPGQGELCRCEQEAEDVWPKEYNSR